jgi:hypothetical protein
VWFLDRCKMTCKIIIMRYYKKTICFYWFSSKLPFILKFLIKYPELHSCHWSPEHTWSKSRISGATSYLPAPGNFCQLQWFLNALHHSNLISSLIYFQAYFAVGKELPDTSAQHYKMDIVVIHPGYNLQKGSLQLQHNKK